MSAFSTPARTRFTVQHFHRMGEAGIFGENDRIELIEGELIDMAPIGSRHAFAVDELSMRFARLLGEEARVSTQNPLVLGEHSEPQPDLMLLRPRADSYGHALPGPDDVLLLVEVADSTLDYDRSIKVPLYARHGIPEVWIVALESRRLEIYREPLSTGYRTHFAIGPESGVSPVALPHATIMWGTVFA